MTSDDRRAWARQIDCKLSALTLGIHRSLPRLQSYYAGRTVCNGIRLGHVPQIKTFENRVRRMARRQGLSVVKSRSPIVCQTWGGYMVCDERNCIVAGGVPSAYGMQISDVFEYLNHLEGEAA